MRYGSVCSGVEAASLAWGPMGWQAQFFSEIEKFPCAVLKHHWPDVPNHGDMTRFKEWPDHAIDILVGGTPCQSFSVAGLRAGLADPRGNLMLTFGAVAQRYSPKWIVWENVPGVLSSNGGRDFGAFLGLLGQCGYGFAYRIFDTQFTRTFRFPWAVPQRRRRVFVVGYLGDWRPAAAVLFDGESLRWNPAPRRKAGQGIARGFETGPTGGGITDVAPTLDTRCKDGPIRNQLGVGVMDYVPPIVSQAMSSKWSKGSSGPAGDEVANLVAHTLRGNGFDASEDGTGRGTPLVAWPLTAGMAASAHRMPQEQGALVPVAFDSKGTQVQTDQTGAAPTLRAMGHADSHQNGGGQMAIAIQERAISENPNAGPDGAGIRQDGAAYTMEARTVPQAVAYGLSTQQEPKWVEDVSPSLALPSKTGGGQVTAVAFDLRGREGGAMPEGPHDTASVRAADGGSSRSYLAMPWAVRRLTPKETERLQAMPDNHTQIPWRGKPADQCPDGPRYKAIGNSMSVNVMEWIGARINAIEGLKNGGI